MRERRANVGWIHQQRDKCHNEFHIRSRQRSRGGPTPLFGEHLRDIPITAIYSGPVLRARETAEILPQSFHLLYQVTEALREYDCGILEEKSDAESWMLNGEIAEDWTLNHNYLRKPEGGESYLDIKKRFIPFIESFTQSDLHSQAHILCVAHGGLLQLMLPEVLKNIDHTFVRSHGINHTQCILAELLDDKLVCKQWGTYTFDPVSR